MAVLFVGRFQPLHLGHLSVIEWLRAEGYDQIIIGIGSSQYSGTDENPLSFAQRSQCWQQLYPELPVVAIPDIHDDAHWVEHVRKVVYTVYPSGFDQFVSGNPWVERLATEAGLSTLIPPQTLRIDATTIRQLIRNHDDAWKHYVPATLHNFIQPSIAGSGAKTEARA